MKFQKRAASEVRPTLATLLLSSPSTEAVVLADVEAPSVVAIVSTPTEPFLRARTSALKALMMLSSASVRVRGCAHAIWLIFFKVVMYAMPELFVPPHGISTVSTYFFWKA
jgi:hypothetical protein